jgi:hypothetical protein
MFPDASMTRRASKFSEAELVNLTLCVAAINAWNRIAISFRAVHLNAFERRNLRTEVRLQPCRTRH